jgi:hypothetical protein
MVIHSFSSFKEMATEALSNVKFETLTAKGFTKLAKATYYGEDP